MVETKRIELSTLRMRTVRAPSCATPPCHRTRDIIQESVLYVKCFFKISHRFLSLIMVCLTENFYANRNKQERGFFRHANRNYF